jgi:hypothetical protein
MDLPGFFELGLIGLAFVTCHSKKLRLRELRSGLFIVSLSLLAENGYGFGLGSFVLDLSIY